MKKKKNKLLVVCNRLISGHDRKMGPQLLDAFPGDFDHHGLQMISGVDDDSTVAGDGDNDDDDDDDAKDDADDDDLTMMMVMMMKKLK